MSTPMNLRRALSARKYAAPLSQILAHTAMQRIADAEPHLFGNHDEAERVHGGNQPSVAQCDEMSPHAAGVLAQFG